MARTVTQWESGSLIKFKMFPHYYLISLDRRKSNKLHLQNDSDLLPFLFAFNYQNYIQYLTQHHVELANLSIAKPQAFSDLKAFSLGVSLRGNKFLTIPGDLVNEVIINRDVKVRIGPMRGGAMLLLMLRRISFYTPIY